jgi:DNA-binding protein HU-beta
MPMTKSELISHFAETTALEHAQVRTFFAELLSLAVREVQCNREFVIPGLGKLVKSERQARLGRNPATGEAIEIPARTALRFRLNKAIKTACLESDLYLPLDDSLECDPHTGSDSYKDSEANLHCEANVAGDPYTRSDRHKVVDPQARYDEVQGEGPVDEESGGDPYTRSD